jgi:uncharacterized protein (UPF0335 family)
MGIASIYKKAEAKGYDAKLLPALIRDRKLAGKDVVPLS